MKKVILYPKDELGPQREYLYTLVLHDETLGVTQRALKALRDELLLFQVPAIDGAHCEIYGFFLVDRSAKEIVIIGDGFRGDGGGEGGAGHRAALALLALYGLKATIEVLPEEAILYREDISGYQEMADKVLGIAKVAHFEVASEKTPGYVDWCFRR